VIFVTVGTQLPFERLIKAVDDWAGAVGEEEIFAQTGPCAKKPRFLESREFVSPADAAGYFSRADLIVSHAGMGSILSALRYGKPIVIMPRRASQGEHRNDHQLATAKWLDGRSGIHVASGPQELTALLNQRDQLKSGRVVADHADPEFVARLKSYIFDE
jgi:UDP-N-acetylglucosamine transferase subunit ALG13